MKMRSVLVIWIGALIFSIGVACESSDEESAPVAAQIADLSQFPTPTLSQARPAPTSSPPTAQPSQTQDMDETSEAPPMTQDEMRQLRQRLQSGELSEEEAQQAIQRIRAQLGGGQGGPPFGGDAGSVAVGSIESVVEDEIVVKTDIASIKATIREDTNIRITSLIEPDALADGAQVMVVSERVEGRVLARAITIIPDIPEGQDGFRGGPGGQGRGQGGLGGGQGEVGVGSLFGSVQDANDAGFLLETQQGPLPIAIDDDSVIVQTRQGTMADLEVGMAARVVGPADESGVIDARSVVVTPEEMQGIRGLGGNARN